MKRTQDTNKQQKPNKVQTYKKIVYNQNKNSKKKNMDNACEGLTHGVT